MNRGLQSRKCSHCGHNGHNSRTCHGKGVFKLFGVKINLGGDEKEYLDESSSSMTMITKRNECECMRKSKSMDNLVQACNFEHDHDAAGYLSDGLIHAKFDRATASHERKKGLPWTEDEHRSFLIGLKKLGKGDWKGISKNYVPTKTSTQVASHAQKYFIRMTSTDKKRRHSLFDIPFKESTPQTSPVSPIDKAAEVSQQDGTTLVAPLKSINEIQGQASTLILGGASEKPPLSPMARTHVPNICHMPYMVGVPGQSFTTAMFMPRELFPMMNYPNPDYIYLPSSNGNFASCAPFMNQKSSSLCFGPFPQAGPTTSAARSFATCAPFPNQTSHGPVTSDGKKDGLEASIGALSL